MNEERPGGPIRIGDREREDAVKRLGEHYEAGRLTAEEHSDRVEQALKAKTDADLNSLFGDLPWAGPENSAAGAGNPGAGSGGFGGRPPWAARGFIGQIPLPLLIMLGVFGVLASIGCVFGAGHPPILPILLIVAAVSVIRKRRMERQA